MKKLLTLTLLLAAGSMCPRAAWLKRIPETKYGASIKIDLTRKNNNHSYKACYLEHPYKKDAEKGCESLKTGMNTISIYENNGDIKLDDFPVPWAENGGAYMTIGLEKQGTLIGKLFLQKKEWPGNDLVYAFWATDPSEMDRTEMPTPYISMEYTKYDILPITSEDEFDIIVENDRIRLQRR